MVDRISRIFNGQASSPAEISLTLNLDSDSENAWVAARQSKINHDLEERKRAAKDEPRHQIADDGGEGNGDDTLSSRQWPTTSDGEEPGEGGSEEACLSGESPRIGTQNFDEDTPFGDRVAIV